MAKEIVKKIKKITFDLSNDDERELYELLNDYKGAGTDMLLKHYKFYKNNLNQEEFMIDEEDALISEHSYEEEEEYYNEDEITEEILEDIEDLDKRSPETLESNGDTQVIKLLNSFLRRPEDLFTKAAHLLQTEEDFVLHIIDKEVLSDREYQKRVWRPHFELDSKKRDGIAIELYSTSNPFSQKQKAAENSRKYKRNGVLRKEFERMEYEEELERGKSILSSFISDLDIIE